MIAELVRDTLAAVAPTPIGTLEDVRRADRAAREEIEERVKTSKRQKVKTSKGDLATMH